MDRWERVMKCILLTVNVVILIVGTIITITSVWSLISKPSYTAGTKGFINAIFIALLIFGIIWMSIAIFGIVAVLRKVKCMLLTYAIIIFILFIMNVIGQVEQYNSQNEMIKLLEKRLKYSMQLYNDNTFVRNFWDMTQSTYECCGLNSWKDWKVNGLTVPDSCCKSDQQSDCILDWQVYVEGCINDLRSQIQHLITIVNGINAAFTSLLFFGLMSSSILYKKIKYQQSTLYDAGLNNQDTECMGLRNI